MKKVTTLFTMALLIASLAYGQDKAIDYKTLLDKIPESIKGYSQDGDPDGMNMDMNGMAWASATRNFSNGDKNMSITIVDYHGAASMYTGFAMAWGNSMHFENESSIAGTTTVDGFPGVENYDKKEKSSSLILGVNERYYLSIQVDEDLDFAKSIVSTLKLSSLPE